MSVSAMSTSIKQSVSQTSAPSTSRGASASSILKHAAIGGAIGAVALGALTFTTLPLIGGRFAPIAAAIGGAAGLLIGGLVGFLRGRSSSDDAKTGATLTMQTPPPPPGTGAGLNPPLPPALPG